MGCMYNYSYVRTGIVNSSVFIQTAGTGAAAGGEGRGGRGGQVGTMSNMQIWNLHVNTTDPDCNLDNSVHLYYVV